jgi:uncharacterized membrane protein
MSNRSKKNRRLTQWGETADPVPAEQYNLRASFRSGPFPPPAEMEKYETLMPGATKVLFNNFIHQSNHRIELEKEVIRGDNRRADRGQLFSFILGMSCLAIGAVLFIFNKDSLGIAAVITAIAPIASAFLGSSMSRKRERENKRKQIGG